jgi:hypothetical protein
MPQPGQLPPDVRGSIFLVPDAKARGVSAGRLRSLDLLKPHRGVRSHHVRVETVFDRCLHYAVLMPATSAFSHSTAAALYSMPLPYDASDSPLHVTVRANGQPPRARGIVGHRGRDDQLPLWTFETVRVCAPADVWCQLAVSLTCEDLIAVGDYLISGQRTDFGREPPLATLAELTAAVNRRVGGRGVRSMRMALPKLRTRVDSRPESLLRLLLVASGLPEPLIGDPTLVDEGASTLHPDLKYVQWRVVFEYEGDGHRTDPRRFRADIARRERFEAAGWHVIRVTLDDLFINRAAFVARVRAILRDRERYLSSRVQ